MHVLASHPFFWPYVARGAEREVHDVGVGLVRRGHRVDLVTGRPTGVTSRAVVDGLSVRYVRTPLPGVFERRGLQREGAFGAVVAAAALRSGADVVTCFHYADAVGAASVRALRRRPIVLKLTGTVPRDRVEKHPLERRLLQRALDVADEVWVNSRYALEAMAGWDREMRVLPAGLDEATFVAGTERHPRPTVLCASTPDEPRKRVVDLVDAWPAVVDAVPDAQLQLAGAASAETRATLIERLPEQVRDSVVFLGTLRGADLAAAYGRAHVVAAPSVYEALGLVTLEALACGTPVAGSRSGATPELLDRPGTGTLFEPADPTSCAEAVVAALGISADADVRDRCRASAMRWAVDGVVDQVEHRLQLLVGAQPPQPVHLSPR
ncbi:MAG: glycosyl transferase group 1 [Frankiales bacterium]|nr:glycosyl transferase group 1 [Frankiales bacterium]